MSGRGAYYKEKYGGGRGRRGGGRGGGRDRRPSDQEGGWGGAGVGEGATGEEPYGQVGRCGTEQDLRQSCIRIDGNSYKAYHDLKGRWDMAQQAFVLCIEHIQADPFAAPSKLRIEMPARTARLPPELWSSRVRKVALCDYLARSFHRAIRQAGADRKRGGGGWAGEKGGDMQIDSGGQHVLERTAVMIDSQGHVEARFTVGLPARGRTILGRFAAEILTEHVPRVVLQALCYQNQDLQALRRHIQCVEDTEALRSALPGMGLLAFVGNGAILPRASGASEEPFPKEKAVAFTSPPSLEVEVRLPNAGTVKGMGIGQGVTLIVGGGFHGKSTLLKALEAGYTNKIPGDGRELVVTTPSACKIRAEDGRRVEGVDISPFINNLPMGKDTKEFCTDDASGSTSQAANIMEALEIGTELLLIDEDTTATNFMIRDSRMQALIAPDKEPITPLVARIAAMCDCGTSCILVIGGSGDYFAQAKRVIAMDAFKPHDVTRRAHEIAAAGEPAPPAPSIPRGFQHTRHRVPLFISSPASGHNGEPKIQANDVNTIRFGDDAIDLSAVEQLFDPSQTRAVGQALALFMRRITQPVWQGRTLADLLTALDAEMDKEGLDVLAPWKKMGTLARPRKLEIAAAFNRLRTVATKAAGS